MPKSYPFLLSASFLSAKYTLPPNPPTQHRMGTIVIQTPQSTSQPVLASTPAPCANFRKMRRPSPLPRFHTVREAQQLQKPALLPVRQACCPSLKGLLLQCSLTDTRSSHGRQHRTTTSSETLKHSPAKKDGALMISVCLSESSANIFV